jgi:hypothetical protein
VVTVLAAIVVSLDTLDLPLQALVVIVVLVVFLVKVVLRDLLGSLDTLVRVHQAIPVLLDTQVFLVTQAFLQVNLLLYKLAVIQVVLLTPVKLLGTEAAQLRYM